MFRLSAALSFPLLLLGLAMPAHANDTPLTYDRIGFSVTAMEQVDNDTLIAILYFQREGEDTSKLAGEVNRVVQWGIEEARKSPEVKVQTLDYYTNPVYQNQKLRGWRVTQSIRLESQDSAVLSQLIATLQQRLAVRSISYDVSPERRSEVEDRLIAGAINGFKKRAALITNELDRSGFRLVRMDVNTASVAPLPRQRRALAMQAEAAVTPPSLEAGTQTLEVSVSGTIELNLD